MKVKRVHCSVICFKQNKLRLLLTTYFIYLYSTGVTKSIGRVSNWQWIQESDVYTTFAAHKTKNHLNHQFICCQNLSMFPNANPQF